MMSTVIMRKKKGFTLIMRKKKGFTLVELLVVIAIIALLMSILMPALGRARQQAKEVICKSNLKQWGNVFSMYTNDHDGYFHAFGAGYTPEHWWPISLRKYYLNPELGLCPMATKTWTDGADPMSPFSAWGVFDEDSTQGLIRDEWIEGYGGIYGSYGINEWVSNIEEPEFWKSANVSGAAKIPLFLDSNFIGGFPTHLDEPPEFENFFSVTVGEMVRYCLNRHNGHVNCLFVDFSVREVGLKELWTLKWNQTFATNGPWTLAGGASHDDWPEWMNNFSDY